MIKRVVLSICAVAGVLLVTHLQASKVVFFGDSITAFGERAGGYVEGVRAAMPEGVTVLGSGVPGNKVGDLVRRYERDIATQNPDLVVVWIGVNDVWHWADLYTGKGMQGTTEVAFRDGLRDLVMRIREDGAQAVLCTPAVIGERQAGGNPQDEMLEQYAEIMRELARIEEVPLIDLRSAFVNYLRLHNSDDQAQGILTEDGVHLNDTGNRFVAEMMLAYLRGEEVLGASLPSDTDESDTPSAVFVREGEAILVLYEGEAWESTPAGPSASGTGRILFGGESLGAGDVEVRARLTLTDLDASAASFVIDESHIGFASANGRMFLQGPAFGGQRMLAPWRDFIEEGVPFDLVVRRIGPEIIVAIDGQEVVRAPERRSSTAFGPVGLRPWRADMMVHDFSVRGALAPGRVSEARFPGPIRPFAVPRIDLSENGASRSVVAQGTPSDYKGHPTTVALEGDTILCTYPLGHGGPGVVLRRSEDRGRTWSPPLPLPENWAESTNCPSIYELEDPGGVRRLFVFEGRYGMRQAHSEDGGQTWTPMASNGLPSIMPFTSIIPLKDGRLLGAWNVGRGSWLSESSDGGLTWGPAREVAAADADFPEAFPVEPFLLRSPDGKEIAMILRENARRYNSLVMFSRDEGKTWTKMRELSRELTGDRHIGGYLPDGRLFLAYRDTAPGSQDFGHYVGWLGSYEDLTDAGSGLARFKLVHNYDKYDCGYSGVEIYPSGEVVATTYADIDPGPARQSVLSVFFKPGEFID